MSRFDEFFLDLLIFRANFEMFRTMAQKKRPTLIIRKIIQSFSSYLMKTFGKGYYQEYKLVFAKKFDILYEKLNWILSKVQQLVLP